MLYLFIGNFIDFNSIKNSNIVVAVRESEKGNLKLYKNGYMIKM